MNVELKDSHAANLAQILFVLARVSNAKMMFVLPKIEGFLLSLALP